MASKAIRFINGDYAVVPRAEYEKLKKAAREAAEDAADRRALRETQRAIAEGREVLLPKAYAIRIMKGENPVRVARDWRGMAQGDLANVAGISQSYLSEIEAGNRKGTAELHKKLARALSVPTDLLIGE